MNVENDEKKCAHGICNCLAAADGDYCSPYCEGASDTEVVQLCDCGHPTCIG